MENYENYTITCDVCGKVIFDAKQRTPFLLNKTAFHYEGGNDYCHDCMSKEELEEFREEAEAGEYDDTNTMEWDDEEDPYGLYEEYVNDEEPAETMSDDHLKQALNQNGFWFYRREENSNEEIKRLAQLLEEGWRRGLKAEADKAFMYAVLRFEADEYDDESFEPHEMPEDGKVAIAYCEYYSDQEGAENVGMFMEQCYYNVRERRFEYEIDGDRDELQFVEYENCDIETMLVNLNWGEGLHEALTGDMDGYCRAKLVELGIAKED